MEDVLVTAASDRSCYLWRLAADQPAEKVEVTGEDLNSPVSSLALVKTNVPAVCSRGYLLTSTLSGTHLLTGLIVIFARTHGLCAAAVFGYICNCNLCAGKLSFLVLCLWCMLILKVDKIKCNGNVHKRREVLMFIVRGNFMN